MIDIPIRTTEVIATVLIGLLQFFPDPSHYRYFVLGLAVVVVVCSISRQLLEMRRRRLWEDGQVQRDKNLIIQVLQELKPSASIAAALPQTSALPKSSDIDASEPRLYPTEIKEIKDAIFPRTAFVLANRGGNVAHKVQLEMLLRLKGRNVNFPTVETVPVNESCEILPTIGDGEPLSNKNDIYQWFLDDWNANSSGIAEEWPREMNIRWRNHNGERFVCAFTLVFHPINYLLRKNGNWPNSRFVISEFRDLRFSRDGSVK